MARQLTDRIIVITGASSGIGRATAVECAKAGMHVVLNARRADRLKSIAAVVEGLNRRAVVVAGDVAEDGMSDRLLNAAEEQFGRFDVVFANAGYGMEKSMHELSEKEVRQMFEVNFFASTELLVGAARRLIAAERQGHLLMCSSCLAKFSTPLHGHYSATKAAQNQVCWAMRSELMPYGIDVSSVLPITTTTEFFEASAERSGKASAERVKPDSAPRFMMQPPEKVARAVVRCLRRPKPEVWTSFLVRAVAAAMTLSPSFGKLIMLTQQKKVDQAVKRHQDRAASSTGHAR